MPAEVSVLPEHGRYTRPFAASADLTVSWRLGRIAASHSGPAGIAYHCHETCRASCHRPGAARRAFLAGAGANLTVIEPPAVRVKSIFRIPSINEVSALGNRAGE